MLLMTTLENFFPKVWERDGKGIAYFSSNFNKQKQLVMRYIKNGKAVKELAVGRYSPFRKVPAQPYAPSILLVSGMKILDIPIENNGRYYDIEIKFSFLKKVDNLRLINEITTLPCTPLLRELQIYLK